MRAAFAREAEGSIVRVWPEHWHATLVFLGMQTQWRCTVLPSGRWHHQGLDYAALQPVLDEHAGTRHARAHADVMRQLHRLEDTARNQLNRPE